MEKIKEFFKQNTNKLTKYDAILITIITLAYAIFSFINLGDNVAPQTFAELTAENNTVYYEIKSEFSQIGYIRMYPGNQTAKYDIYTSTDKQEWKIVGTANLNTAFGWTDFNCYITKDMGKYIKIVCNSNKGSLGEVAFYSMNNEKLVAKTDENSIAKLTIDEQDAVPEKITHMNFAYFDETYFPRAAYQFIHGIPSYETVHPNMGKAIMAVPIMIFGMTPFAWRFAGNLCGIIMIPVMYIIAKRIFKNSKFALIAGLLMIFDNFHFAQTRMGTVDTELVLFNLLSILFMIDYCQTTKKTNLWKRLLKLLLSGLFFGLAISTKWTGAATGAVIAIMFFYDTYRKNFKGQKWTPDTTLIIVNCFTIFIVIPLMIYFLSYMAFPSESGKMESISDVIAQNQSILEYHTKLTEHHPYESKWYTWPITQKPVFLYCMPRGNDSVESLSNCGNPAIWWVASIATVFTLIRSIVKKDKIGLFIIIALLINWIPYMPITRCMFIYHFFPSLPFLMLGLVYGLKFITEKLKKNYILLIYIIIVITVFCIFYPVSSGMVVSKEYMKNLQWLPTWTFTV